MFSLLVNISAHGLGHLGQTAPVINALYRAVPHLELTVRSAVPLAKLQQRIDAPFRHENAATDFGYSMRNAIDLDLSDTAQRYRDFHQDWNSRVEKEAAWLGQRGFDAVLSNVAYLPLAGAARAGIRAIAISSINWADLFEDNFGGDDWSRPILHDMREAYRTAGPFLRITPGLPMNTLQQLQVIGPVCQMRKSDRLAIAQRLGIDTRDKWLLVGMGGIDFPIDISCWPRTKGIRYLVSRSVAIERDDVTAIDGSVINFVDVLAAADVIVSKPGYGILVEAACHGRPVLYIPRSEWSEGPYLTKWLHENTRAICLDRSKFMKGRFMSALADLLSQPAPAIPLPTGISAAVEAIGAIIGRT